jgi:hypothetical protein
VTNTGWAIMCPVGALGGEIADTEPELWQVTAKVIASWIDTGTRYLADMRLSQADARAVMYALLTSLKGGFLLARVQRTVEPLLAAGHAVSAYIAAMPVATQARGITGPTPSPGRRDHGCAAAPGPSRSGRSVRTSAHP